MPGDGLLTIVMPTRNHAQYIRQALDSFVAQTRRPDRLVVLDDASTDDTPRILRSYAERYAFISVITHARNAGGLECAVEALATVETEYVMFAASDDFVDVSLCAKSLALMDLHPQAGLCAVNVIQVDEKGRFVRRCVAPPVGGSATYLDPKRFLRLLTRHGSLFYGLGTVYRTELLRSAGGFDETLKSFADDYVNQVLSAKNGACVIPEFLGYWRRLEHSYSHTTASDPAEYLAILDATLRRLKGPDRTVFSEEYRHRLEYRMRFGAAVAAMRSYPVDRPLLRRAIARRGGPIGELLVLKGWAFGETVGSLTLFALLRPWDIVRVLAVRIGRLAKRDGHRRDLTD
ncbi:MAG TPA: glycosyltransferase family A protein [Gemmatimonadaceae bacterium]|nr:glycosyltransferase family A protein [Gemmatimonadaceae bacterium]